LVLADSHHLETLEALREDYPELSWREVEDAEALDLMEMVSRGEAPFALVNSNEFTANHSYYPKLRVGFNLIQEDELAWVFPAGDDNKRLQQRASIFLQRITEDGTLDLLKEQLYGHAWGANPVGSQTFTRRMKQRLPKYERLIREVATEYQVDWHLLAAISYQESHWNPHARSPTGVRGMMMLTMTTAQEMDIDDRLDPAQSLRGGARYFKKLRRRLPEDIEEPDRSWMALAAYNIGRGHLEDARVLTERQGGDPDLWKDVRERLPLLQKSKYYKTVKHGYARGSEPVTYVKNIRQYYDILAWQDIARNRPLPPVSTEEYVHPILRDMSLSTL
jgi:membrane-bound lytic murein transglycosylase F